MASKYFNAKPMGYKQQQRVANRRDVDKIIQSSHRAYMLLGLWTLHEEFGFGASRMERFAEAWQESLRKYNSGELKLDGVARIMSDDYGIEYMIQ